MLMTCCNTISNPDDMLHCWKTHTHLLTDALSMLCWLGKQCHEESNGHTSPHLFPHLYLSDTALAHNTQLLYLIEIWLQKAMQIIHQPSMYALCHGRVHANTMNLVAMKCKTGIKPWMQLLTMPFLLRCMQLSLRDYNDMVWCRAQSRSIPKVVTLAFVILGNW